MVPNACFKTSSFSDIFHFPEKPKLKCLGFTYSGAKLFNMLPLQMRETKNPNTFKNMSKDWIWKNISSYQSICLLLLSNKLDKKKAKYTVPKSGSLAAKNPFSLKPEGLLSLVGRPNQSTM